MSIIKRIGFQKSINDSIDFEIVKLHNFFENRYKEKLISAHRLDFYIIMHITSGTGKHEIDFNTYDITKGDVVFIAKNQVHRFLPETDVGGYEATEKL